MIPRISERYLERSAKPGGIGRLSGKRRQADQQRRQRKREHVKQSHRLDPRHTEMIVRPGFILRASVNYLHCPSDARDHSILTSLPVAPGGYPKSAARENKIDPRVPGLRGLEFQSAQADIL